MSEFKPGWFARLARPYLEGVDAGTLNVGEAEALLNRHGERL
jgi:hypothetical protein